MTAQKTKQPLPEIKIHSQVETLSVKDITLNDWNPNFVPGDIREAIKDDISQNGFVGPIVIQKYNERMKKKNVIINGEHRFNILKELGGKEVPATIVDVDDTIAQVLTLRLNREHGEMLPNRIGDVLNLIAKKNRNDMEAVARLTFYKQKELDDLMNLRSKDVAAVTAHQKAVSFNAKKKMVSCPDCGCKFEV